MKEKKPAITRLNGRQLKHSIIASAAKVEQKQEELNDINVFPVADGDTGTNMAETLRSIAERAHEVEHDSFSEVSSALADTALENARGNSGVILAQFFQGLAESSAGKDEVAPTDFAQAVEGAVAYAESAVSQPKEGTILTVMRDWAAHIKEHAHLKEDFVDLLKGALARARQSLSETPKKLQVLRKAGVVDAGAQGFVHLLEGIQEFLENGRFAALSFGSQVAEALRHHVHRTDEAVRFRYCTQCLILGEGIDRDHIKAQLTPLGDSLIVIGNPHKVRVHIHTNRPQEVFAIAARFGTVAKTKTEDMRAQVENKIGRPARSGIALITDSTCDLPEEVIKRHQIFVVPVHLKIKDRSFIDRVEIQPEEFYKLFAESGGVISTSQPTPAAFVKAYAEAAETRLSAIAVFLSGALSGTLNGGLNAVRSIEDKLRVDVVDSRSTSAGLGLIVQEAARLIERGFAHEEVLEKLTKLIPKLRFFVSIPSLKQLLKSGRVPKMKGWVAELLNIHPVISFNAEGRLVQAAKAFGRKALNEKVYRLTEEYAATLKNPRFGIAHVMNRPLAEEYRERLVRRFRTDDVFIVPASPALGAHVGFNACGIAVIGD
ncbi:MAG: DegV family EDD domain-containing protein [candidate division KSB1 bacterium]|nr:DegV family EDD domain-containing protein [candidate division KSB1 bacterium]